MINTLGLRNNFMVHCYLDQSLYLVTLASVKSSKASMVISNITFPCSWYFLCVHSSEIYQRAHEQPSGSLLKAEIWMFVWLLFSNVTTKKQVLTTNSQSRSREITKKLGILYNHEFVSSNYRTHMKIYTFAPMIPAQVGGQENCLAWMADSLAPGSERDYDSRE